MSINKELEKKEMRLLASKFDGTSIADSFTVSNKYNLLICGEVKKVKVKRVSKGEKVLLVDVNSTLYTFSFQASDSGAGNLMAPADANN